MPFMLRYAVRTIGHIESVEPKYRGLIRKVLDQQLRHQPLILTRNRKPMKRPSVLGATWEIRFGPGNRFRAYYDVDETEHVVEILAIGVKEGGRLRMGGEEVGL
jgi:hypothetical protein